MVTGYPHNAWGKFDNFHAAAVFVYDEAWFARGNVFVHWGAHGEPSLRLTNSKLIFNFFLQDCLLRRKLFPFRSLPLHLYLLKQVRMNKSTSLL